MREDVLAYLAMEFGGELKSVVVEVAVGLASTKDDEKAADTIKNLMSLLPLERRSTDGSSLLHSAGIWITQKLIEVLKGLSNLFAPDGLGGMDWEGEVSMPPLTLEDLHDFTVKIAETYRIKQA